MPKQERRLYHIYRNGDPEDVVFELFGCTDMEAQAINYNLEMFCNYGHEYTLRLMEIQYV